MNSHVVLSDQYHLFTDRLHAGGLVTNEFEFIVRRSTHFADIIDYPEPSTNVWEKEHHLALRHELKFAPTTNHRHLKEGRHSMSQYHRFFWMLYNNCEPDKQNLRVEDDLTFSLDPQHIWIVKDLDKKQEKRLERNERMIDRAERELEADLVVLSMLEDRKENQGNQKRQKIQEALSLIQDDVLPWYIDILSVSRPFVLMDGLVVRFENLLSEDSKMESAINVCNLFLKRVVTVLFVFVE